MKRSKINDGINNGQSSFLTFFKTPCVNFNPCSKKILSKISRYYTLVQQLLSFHRKQQWITLLHLTLTLFSQNSEIFACKRWLLKGLPFLFLKTLKLILFFQRNICTPVCVSRFFTVQKMKFSIKDFFSKCDQIRRKLWIWSHLLKKSLMEKFIFCAVF